MLCRSLSNVFKPVFVALTIVAVLVSVEPAAAMNWELFKDSEDGALDLSDWLMTKHGFMPVPVIITEPAVGPGLGLAAVFFHGNLVGTQSAAHPDRMLPPSATVAVGAYTSNDTWFAGGGHFGSWKQDSIRYTGFLGMLNLNIDFYALDRPVALNIDGGFLLQEAKFRIGASDFFIGGKWVFFDSTSRFKVSGDNLSDFPEIGEDGFKSTNSGLGAVAYFDSRDNVFTPDTGQEINLEILRYDQAIGGDFDYWYLNLQALSYHQLHDKFVLGLRLQGEAVDGSVPFYAYPFVQLRGIPAMRYQGKQVLDLEIEGRWRIYKRWSLIGFLGHGYTESVIPRFETEDTIQTFGTGFRYLIARKFKMHVGIDVARGPEDTALYLVMGSSWSR